jgi:hypothetical protein
MSKLKLTYFDFHGGRGESARLALSIGGIPFEDDRVPRLRSGKVARRTPRSALYRFSKGTGRSSRSRMQSTAMSASSRISTRLIRGRQRCATRCWRPWRTSAQKLEPLFSYRKSKKRLGGKSWSQARSHFILPGSSNGSKHTEAGTLPPIASQSPISKSSCGSGTLNQVPSIMCRPTCPIASHPSWLSTMSG